MSQEARCEALLNLFIVPIYWAQIDLWRIRAEATPQLKTIAKDFRGRDVEVMWVKEVVPIGKRTKAEHFTCLRLDDIRPLMQF